MKYHNYTFNADEYGVLVWALKEALRNATETNDPAVTEDVRRLLEKVEQPVA